MKTRFVVPSVLGVIMALATTVAPAHSAVPFTTTLSPPQVADTVGLKNTMAGQYLWQNTDKAPQYTNNDSYSRIFWRSVEPTNNAYNTWEIDQGLERAGRNKGTFGFRIMSVCQGCSSENKTMPDFMIADRGTWRTSENIDVPDYNSEKFLQQWDELMVYLGSKYDKDPRLGYVDVGGYGNWGEWHSYPYESQYGANGRRDITLESARRMVSAVERNFTTTPVVMNTTGARDADSAGNKQPTRTTQFSDQLWYDILHHNNHIGIRNDCLGAGVEQASAIEGVVSADTYTNGAFSERWKSAPVITEYCGATKPPRDINHNGVIEPWEYHDYTGDGKVEDWEAQAPAASFASAREQVQNWHVSMVSSDNFTGKVTDFPVADQKDFAYNATHAGYRYGITGAKVAVDSAGHLSIDSTWKNSGTAPTYHPWNVVYRVKNVSTGKIVSTIPSRTQLSTMLPGNTTVKDVGTQKMGPGRYELSVLVKDSENYLNPMSLTMRAKNTDGSFVVGQFTVR